MTEKKHINLNMKNISIEFPGVKALSEVDFQMESGKIHALIGANGAGKSTLMKVLSGVNSHYTGSIYINDDKVEIRSPKEAKKLGIEIVYQEVDTALIPYLSVGENIMLNTIVNKMDGKHFMNWKDIYKRAEETLLRLNINVNVQTLVSDLSLAQKQMILIARAIVEECNFLILDEPTAPLSDTETKELFKIIRHLVSTENLGVIFISHRINELFEICESITIMRDGEVVTDLLIDDNVTQNQIVELMLGRRFDETYPKHANEIGEVLLNVENLTEKELLIQNISLTVKQGEIIGISGLVGAGKTELCKTLFGALKTTSGKVILNGSEVKIKSPTDAVKNRLALVPEERRKEGVLVEEPVFINLSTAALSKYVDKFSFIKQAKEKSAAKKIIQDLGIKTPNESYLVKLLSGGNQQKVAVGKWIVSDADVYIFDEPTKGVDVGAKRDIFDLIQQLAKAGKGIIYCTCEFNEILGITDRTYVMYDGKIVKELQTAHTNEEELLFYSTGGADFGR